MSTLEQREEYVSKLMGKEMKEIQLEEYLKVLNKNVKYAVSAINKVHNKLSPLMLERPEDFKEEEAVSTQVIIELYSNTAELLIHHNDMLKFKEECIRDEEECDTWNRFYASVKGDVYCTLKSVELDLELGEFSESMYT